MKALQDRIRRDGKVRGDIVLVDTFLNHQVDVDLVGQMAKATKEHFKNQEVSKILTIESSGIAIATIVAQEFAVPMVFAKKNKSSNLQGDVYSTEVASYTHKNTYNVFVKSTLIQPEDKILLVDDFLAQGNAIYGLIDIVKQAGAEIVGVSIAVEKGFQSGGRTLRADGYKVYSMAIVDGFEDGEIIFR